MFNLYDFIFKMLEVYLLFFGKNCLILVFYILDVIIIKVIIFMIWVNV